jgi:hypothetical protein
MRSLSRYGSNWSGGIGVPNVNAAGWNILAIPAAALVVMGVLQAVSFGSFKDFLDGVRIGAPTLTGILIIIAEFWAALSLLRIPLPAVFRYFGILLSILVSGFWFVENLFFTTSSGGQLPNSGFFGKYLTQSPGWWTVVEVSILLFWIIHSARLLKWRVE